MGDETSGFSLQFDPSPPCIRVRAWGFWNVEVASAFGRAVQDACRGRPSGTTLELDMNELKPMRDEGQTSVSTLLAAAPSLGIAATVIKTANQLTKLQLMRLAGERVKMAQVRFV